MRNGLVLIMAALLYAIFGSFDQTRAMHSFYAVQNTIHVLATQKVSQKFFLQQLEGLEQAYGVPAQLHIAQVYKILGSPQTAVMVLERIPEKQRTKDVWALLTESDFIENTGLSVKGHEYAAYWLMQEPGSALALNMLALSAYAKQDLNTAVAYWKEALHAIPKYDPQFAQIVRLLVQLVPSINTPQITVHITPRDTPLYFFVRDKDNLLPPLALSYAHLTDTVLLGSLQSMVEGIALQEGQEVRIVVKQTPEPSAENIAVSEVITLRKDTQLHMNF